MALFNVSVLAHLQLPEHIRRAIVQGVAEQGRMAAAAERQAAALELLVAKITEAANEVPPELHDAVEGLEQVTEAVAEAQAP